VDEIYAAAVVRPLVWLSRNVLWKVVDAGMIDGTVNGVAEGAAAVGDTVRHTQSGNTRSYAVWVVVGAIVMLGIVFWPILHPALFGGVR
jgi:NADH-quinone oxidoreductase subunit L